MRRRGFLLLATSLALGWHTHSAAAAAFDSAKPLVHLGTLGVSGDDEPPLSAVIAKAAQGLPTAPPLPQLDQGALSRGVGVVMRSCQVEYETGLRHYVHVDCPGHADYIKNMITGAAQMDGAILVVSATDGPLPPTREHVLLARQVGVPALVVFMNKVDQVEDPDLLDLVETEIRDLLSAFQFDGANTPVIRGSALQAFQGDAQAMDGILRLMDAADQFIPTPERPADKPFLMPVEDVFSISGRGTVATGRVERGTVRAGDQVEIVGFDPVPMPAAVVDLVRVALGVGAGVPGDRLGVVLGGVTEDEVGRGQVLAAPGSIAAHTRFTAEIYVLRKEEGGRHQPFFNGYRPQFYFRTTDVTGEIRLPPGVDFVMPGDHTAADIELITPIAVERGTRFEIVDPRRAVGVGVVTGTPPGAGQ
jgi:elongation factor Tu